MTDNMKDWLCLVSGDGALRCELEEIGGSAEKIIMKAAERGIVLTEEDLAPAGDGELPDDDLDAAGGCSCSCSSNGAGLDLSDGDDGRDGFPCIASGDSGPEPGMHDCSCAMLGYGTGRGFSVGPS